MPGRTSSTFMIWVVAGRWVVWLAAMVWARPTPTKTKRTFNKVTAFFILRTPDLLQVQSHERPSSTGKMTSKKLSSCIYTNVEVQKKALSNVLNTYGQTAVDF